jgi:phosphopantothenoylcysteine decarboxylase/phosphopantothenate--cysteine ligase
MHPANEIRGIKSNKLSKKRIVLGVTGSIATVESIKLSRELIRHGAEVYPVMSISATKIIHPDSLEFATSNKPIVQLTGRAEHISFCGLVKNPVDLLLISPCTANTISKIIVGIDDTPVTTFATTAIGSKIPILIVPAMHKSMYSNKIIQNNIEKGKKMGISFVEPSISGNVAKMLDIEEIVEFVIRKIGKCDLKKLKVLIIGGATAESLDDVRILTNRSSGKTAISLAKSAFERGAKVNLWYGHASEQVPSYIPVKRYESVEDLQNLVLKEKLEFDIIIVCAAIADYIPVKQKGKIPSGKKKYILELSSTPKIIKQIKSAAPKAKIIAYKLEENKRNLKEKSSQLLDKNNIDFVVGNTVSTFGKDENEIIIVNKKGKSTNKKGKKEELANYILDIIKND